MNQHFLFAGLFAFVLHSCNVKTTYTLQNENINTDLKKEIADLDKKVLEAFTTNNTTILNELMSDTLKKSVENLDQLVEEMSRVINNPDYSILDQYYTENNIPGVLNNMESGTNAQNDYTLQCPSFNEVMFFSLLISENNIEKILILNVYGKYPEGWKLITFQVGQYTIAGKTAPEIYADAKLKFNKGYYIDAVLDMSLSSLIANPIQFMKYKKDSEMKQFIEAANSKVKDEYVFPVTIEKVDTKPQVLGMHLQYTNEGYITVIDYLTEIDLGDTSETKKENIKIHNLIGEIFNGIDKNKKCLVYKAYNEIPDGKTAVPIYKFVREIE